jgi:hypothetical protein
MSRQLTERPPCVGSGREPRIRGRGRCRGQGRCPACNQWVHLTPTITDKGFPVPPLLCKTHGYWSKDEKSNESTGSV